MIKNRILSMLILLGVLMLAGPIMAETGNTGGNTGDGAINTDDFFGELSDIVVNEPDLGTEQSIEQSQVGMEQPSEQPSEQPGEQAGGQLFLDQSYSQELLTSDKGVVINGKYHFNVSASLSGDDFSSLVNSPTDDFSIDLGTTLSFDARPDESIRVLGKVVISYPFSPTADVTRSFDDVFHVTELFSDFNIDDKIFFRAGKSTINWGVGYYFSPADLLNLSKIDPEDPDAELEGPVSVKANLPLGMNNLYLYVIAPEGIDSASELALAPKAEFVLGNSEVGLGAYYQKDHVPAAMVTLSSSIDDVSLFSEGVVTYGSDKTFLESVSPTISTVRYDSDFFFKGTAGFMYSWSDDLSNFSFDFSGQYLFNGEGYSQDDQQFVTDNRVLVLGAIASDSPQFSDLSLSDIMETGRHYGAVSAGWKEMLKSDFSLNLFWIGNLSDMSGLLKPSISYKGLDDIDITLGLSYNYGENGDEYTPKGDNVATSLTFSLGRTSF